MHLKVLIIEDCEDDAILLARYLKSCGFETKWQRVDCADELADAVEDRRWDLVLCDLAMPQLTPYVAVDCVREVNPDIPILIVTGAVSEQSAIELLQYGVQDVVLKDDLPRLKSAIARELALARRGREKAAVERRLAAALESLDQGVALYDAEARLITSNSRYSGSLDLLQDHVVPGANYAELIGFAVDHGQFSVTGAEQNAMLERLLAHDTPTGRTPIEIKHHDGRWAEIQRHRTEDGDIVTVVTDITEKKEREKALMAQASELARMNDDLIQQMQKREATEAALRESESRARAIFDSAVDGVITFNPDYQIESVNPAAQTIFGYSAEELMSLHVHHLMLLGENENDPEAAALTKQEFGVPAKDANVRLVTGWRKSGEAFPIELTISPMILDKRTLYTGIIRDVTERTKLDRMKSEFVSVVSHELRTPLTSIRGSLALLNTNAVGELPPRAQSMISIGLKNSERLVNLINDILDIEKIESGKMEFSYNAIRVRDLLDAAVQENKAFLDQFDVEAEIHEDSSDDVMIGGDQDRLMQVLTNLISNAAKFSPSGGQITLGAVHEDGQVRIWVEDKGPGIPETFRKQIFQKFSQADASDTRQKGGTGLGLSIAKAIVEHHNGRISFTTKTGEGATFYFELPALESIAAEEMQKRLA